VVLTTALAAKATLPIRKKSRRLIGMSRLLLKLE
jgi:hypothetical protein